MWNNFFSNQNPKNNNNISPTTVVTLNKKPTPTAAVIPHEGERSNTNKASLTPKPPGAPGRINPINHIKENKHINSIILVSKIPKKCLAWRFTMNPARQELNED